MPLQAIIFDLDGTLLDSLRDIADAVNHSLAANHFPLQPMEAVRRFVGDGIESLVSRSLPMGDRDEETLSRVLRGVREFYAAHWNRFTRPYPDILPLLEKLNQGHVEMAVLSNKPFGFAREMAGYFFPAIPFADVMGAGNGLPLKPDPGGILTLMENHSWPKKATAMVGDSAADILSARRAEIMAVGVSWGFREAEELAKAGAHFVVHSPREILHIAQ